MFHSCFLASCFSSLLVIYCTPLNITVVESFATSHHYCPMSVQPPSALTVKGILLMRCCVLNLHPAIHQLTDDGLARQLAGTVNILAEWLQAEVHACISLIQQNARDRKAARRLFLLQI